MTSKQRTLYIGLLLAAAIAAVYGRVLGHEFIHVFDDGLMITRNPHVLQGLTLEAVGESFTTLRAANWHPLTWISHLVDVELFGLNPAGHHIVNVFFHVANSVLLFLIWQRMTGAPWRSALVAAVFALHPQHVQSVAWVAERKDVLSTFFWLLATWSYVVWTTRRDTPRYLLVLVLLAIGLMAKQMLVTLPFVLLLLDVWPLQRAAIAGIVPAQSRAANRTMSVRQLVIEKLPLLAMVAAASITTIVAQSAGGSVSDLQARPMAMRLQNALVSCATYVVQGVWPVGLAAHYPYPEQLPLWMTLGSAALLLAVTAAAVSMARRGNPAVLVGWLWYLGTLVPVIGIVQVGEQAMADRYTYVPMIGLAIAVCWALPAPRPTRSWVAASAAVSILLAMSVATFVQVGYWRDGETLFRRALAVTERNVVAHTNLATALVAQRRFDAAIEHYRAAVAINPNSALLRSNLGSALMDAGQLEEAIQVLKGAIERDPADAISMINLGNTFMSVGRLPDAADQYRQALAVDPNSLDARLRLGVLLADLKRTGEAIEQLTLVVSADPRQATARGVLGLVLLNAGRIAEALPHLQQAAEAVPDQPGPRMAFGQALLMHGDAAAAAEQFKVVLRMDASSAEAELALGDALRAQGADVQALTHYRRALSLRQQWNQAAVAIAWLLATSRDDKVRDGKQAVALAQQACAQNNHDVRAHDTLGAALAEVGDFSAAVQAIQQAMKAARDARNDTVIPVLQQRLDAFSQQRPWREK